MKEIIIIKPPKNCWVDGYPIHKGHKETSLNKTTLYANQNHILPDEKRLMQSFNSLKKALDLSGFSVVVLDFPNELTKLKDSHYDAVFVRDSGLMFEEYWIKANFSAVSRQPEAECYANIIKEKFNKKIINLPKKAFLEFGEVIYFETVNGSFYFGGLSRANKIGHDFVKKLVKPENYCLIESKGYHLDTVFTPLISKENKLVALIVAKNMLDDTSLNNLKNLDIEIIFVDKKDSIGDEGLGNHAINCLAGPGVLVSGSKFSTPNFEKRLKEFGIKLYVVNLTDYNFAGGSVHCLTNEIYR